MDAPKRRWLVALAAPAMLASCSAKYTVSQSAGTEASAVRLDRSKLVYVGVPEDGSQQARATSSSPSSRTGSIETPPGPGSPAAWRSGSRSSTRQTAPNSRHLRWRGAVASCRGRRRAPNHFCEPRFPSTCAVSTSGHGTRGRYVPLAQRESVPHRDAHAQAVTARPAAALVSKGELRRIIWRRESESNRRTRLCRPLHDHSAIPPCCMSHEKGKARVYAEPSLANLERETSLELATSTLARLRSTN